MKTTILQADKLQFVCVCVCVHVITGQDVDRNGFTEKKKERKKGQGHVKLLCFPVQALLPVAASCCNCGGFGDATPSVLQPPLSSKVSTPGVQLATLTEARCQVSYLTALLSHSHMNVDSFLSASSLSQLWDLSCCRVWQPYLASLTVAKKKKEERTLRQAVCLWGQHLIS